MGFIASFIMGMGALLVFALFGVFILFYVLRSLGLYTMGKNRGMKNAWIAWIPFVRNWLVADLIGGKKAEIWGFGGVNWILTFGALLGILPGIGWIFAIAYLVYYYFAINRLYQIYSEKQSALYTVLSILFGSACAVILFFLRNDKADLALNSDGEKIPEAETVADDESCMEEVVPEEVMDAETK